MYRQCSGDTLGETNNKWMWTLLLLQIHTVPHGAISNCHSEQELQTCTPVVSLLHANWTSANIHSVCWPTASSDVQQGARAANIQAVWGDCLLNILELHAMHRDQCVPLHLSMHTFLWIRLKSFHNAKSFWQQYRYLMQPAHVVNAYIVAIDASIQACRSKCPGCCACIVSSGNPGIHTDDFLSCFMHKPTFYQESGIWACIARMCCSWPSGSTPCI